MRETFTGKSFARLASGVVAVASALSFAAAPAAAETVTLSTRTALSVINPCTGEKVLVTGTVRVEEHERVSTTGAVHYLSVVSATGFRGEAVDMLASQPARYVTSDQTLSEYNSGSATETTFAQRQVYNRLGEDGSLVARDDFRLTLFVHATTTANGRITALRLIELQPEPTCN